MLQSWFTVLLSACLENFSNSLLQLTTPHLWLGVSRMPCASSVLLLFVLSHTTRSCPRAHTYLLEEIQSASPFSRHMMVLTVYCLENTNTFSLISTDGRTQCQLIVSNRHNWMQHQKRQPLLLLHFLLDPPPLQHHHQPLYHRRRVCFPDRFATLIC